MPGPTPETLTIATKVDLDFLPEGQAVLHLGLEGVSPDIGVLLSPELVRKLVLTLDAHTRH